MYTHIQKRECNELCLLRARPKFRFRSVVPRDAATQLSTPHHTFPPTKYLPQQKITTHTQPQKTLFHRGPSFSVIYLPFSATWNQHQQSFIRSIHVPLSWITDRKEQNEVCLTHTKKVSSYKKRTEERVRIVQGKKKKKEKAGTETDLQQFETNSHSILQLLSIIWGPQRSKASFQRGHCQRQRKKR